MNAIGRKQLHRVTTLQELLHEANSGHFGVMSTTYGTVTMWVDDDGRYRISEMRIVGYGVSTAEDAVVLAQDSVERLGRPER